MSVVKYEFKTEVFVSLFNFEGSFEKREDGKNLNFAKQNFTAKRIHHEVISPAEQISLAKHIWGCSSVGRAPALQAGGHGFESHHLHHRKRGPEKEKELRTHRR